MHQGSISVNGNAVAGLKDTLATVQTELQLQSASLSDVQTAVAANSEVSYELSHRVERNTGAQDLLKKLAGQVTLDNPNSIHTMQHDKRSCHTCSLHVLVLNTSCLYKAVIQVLLDAASIAPLSRIRKQVGQLS